MSAPDLWAAARRRVATEATRVLFRRQLAVRTALPLISFTFDDFPRSAFLDAGSILRRYGALGTYYASLGLKAGRYLHRHTAGGQTFNWGVTDLNYLCAFFLEKSRDNPEAVKSLIDQNARARGWLILATHDVCAAPSPFGCTPDFFEQVVQ